MNTLLHAHRSVGRGEGEYMQVGMEGIVYRACLGITVQGEIEYPPVGWIEDREEGEGREGEEG